MNLKPIIPFEPISVTDIPMTKDWIAQIKWDGVRILTYFDGKEVRLFNRRLNERTFHYPEITSIHEYFVGTSVILDGEVIALDKDGKPSFHNVMRRDGLRKLDRVKLVSEEVPIYYMIFDIVYYNGEWVNEMHLRERLSILEKCITPISAQIQTVPLQADGEALWNVAKEHGLEGIVCKNLNSPYTINGKNDSWRKVKNYQDIIAMIAGVTYRSGIVNSVLLGLYDEKGNLWYIGHCGTGKLTNGDWKQLTINIEPLKINEKPFVNEPERMKDVQWIKPKIAVKVQYIEWPEGKTLRQPSIQAFTEPLTSEYPLPASTRSVKKVVKKHKKISVDLDVTHPDKPLWKEPLIIKSQYMGLLQMIFPYMEPFLHNRILTVIRFPHGIFGEPFYQKNCPDYAPSFVSTKELDGINYMICNDIQTFLWLGNQLAFEFHLPFQNINSRGPSEIVFDLDPPSKEAFSLAIKAALIIKEVLDSLHLLSFVKTSGNKGLQIYIPLPDNKFTYEDTRLFTSFMAEYLIAKDPDSFTIERMKKNRGDRLYVDYVQHSEGKTIIAPYSPRGTPKATVATPLFWEEVREGLTMEKFQIPTLSERLKSLGDPFADFFKVKKVQKFDPVLQFLKQKT